MVLLDIFWGGRIYIQLETNESTFELIVVTRFLVGMCCYTVVCHCGRWRCGRLTTYNGCNQHEMLVGSAANRIIQGANVFI